MGRWSRFKEALRHAFAVGGPEERLTAEDEAFLETVAERIHRREMAGPAILLLESIRPLNFVASQAFAAFQPIAELVVPPAESTRCRDVLAKRDAIPRLIEALERRTAPPAAP